MGDDNGFLDDWLTTDARSRFQRRRTDTAAAFHHGFGGGVLYHDDCNGVSSIKPADVGDGYLDYIVAAAKEKNNELARALIVAINKGDVSEVYTKAGQLANSAKNGLADSELTRAAIAVMLLYSPQATHVIDVESRVHREPVNASGPFDGAPDLIPAEYLFRNTGQSPAPSAGQAVVAQKGRYRDPTLAELPPM